MEIHLLSPHFLIYIKFNLCKFNFGRNKLKEIVITFILSCFFFYIYNKEVKFVDSSILCCSIFERYIIYINIYLVTIYTHTYGININTRQYIYIHTHTHTYIHT